MKKYPFYDRLRLAEVADKMLALWKQESTFKASLKKNSTPVIHFFEGPPGANGRPGIHHLFSRTLKDLFCRYKTMQGYYVSRKAGWDAHGLPVELEVEKELGITKEDIGKKISIAEYNKACQESVTRYQEEWNKITERIGYWLDMKNPYITSDTEYISVLWGIIKKLYEKKLVYKGYSIQPYSPAAGTGLSSHELNQPGCYKEVKDISIVAQFKVSHLEDTYLLAWTTTPWTLPANSALAIGKGITYVEIATYNPYTLLPCRVILSKAALSRYFDMKQQDQPFSNIQKGNPLPWKITHHYKAEDLAGWSYKQLMPYVKPAKPFFKVVVGDFVTDHDGTGIVHIAPTFGGDDFMLAKKNDIPAITVTDAKGELVPIVNKKGRFVEAITDFAGLPVKAAYEEKKITQQKDYQSVDLQIAIKLKQENKAFAVSSYLHSYPHCWRTDKPIIYYPLEAWFIKTTAFKKRLIELNKTINWQPPSTGTGRFGEWLKNLVDWNLTRSRFWGTPLPIWITQDGQEEKCIGSLNELLAEIKQAEKAGFMKPSNKIIDNLHRPYVDEVILVSDKGEKMYRQPEVIDVWFDSGGMPYAQYGEMLTTLDTPPPAFPANFIIEGIDQTRGWFFTLHTLAVLLYDQVAFKNVLATGLVLDKHGMKMSKRLGNAIDPNLLLNEHGPDAVRWYMTSNGNPWDDLKFDAIILGEIKRKFFGTLFNTYQFFALYANLDGFSPKNHFPKLAHASELDAWILSRLYSVSHYVERSLDDFSPTRAARALQHFVVDDLSNWYVRLNRKRFWKGEYDEDKEIAYQTLAFCLKVTAQLAAPIAPFYMDQLFRDITQNNKSVHLTDFPKYPKVYSNEALENQMQYARVIASLIHSIRKKHNIKVRIPLSKILIPPASPQQASDIKAVMHIIKSETNVKDVVFISNTDSIIEKKVRPNFYHLGKKHGKYLKGIQKALSQLTQKEIFHFEEAGNHTIALENGERILLNSEDVVFKTENVSGWAVAASADITIALDIKLTPELVMEGMARELVNKVQNLRKDEKLLVNDKIKLTISTESSIVKEATKKYTTYIKTETQASSLVIADSLPSGKSMDIENAKVIINIQQEN